MAYDFTLSSEVLPNKKTVHYAQLTGSNQPKFVIGNRTKYGEYFGLVNTQSIPGLVYNPEDYFDRYGFWAYFIHPTSQGESKGSYLCLNTYDTAKFTFSFMQYGAHVPNGDFVKLFRKLLALPNATDYFPKLVLKDSRIYYKGGDGVLKQMENDLSTKELMDYLNPTLFEIETQELTCAARMVHWATYDPAHYKIQVETAIENYKSNLISYSKRFGLNGFPAKICQMICDIRHQGRGKNDAIANALNTDGNYDLAFRNLCNIGGANYSSRIVTVSNTINSLLNTGIFNKKYDSASNSFVDI
jgi:hypothetical protein